MSSTGVVEHLDKAPERWAFLLRAEDGMALNVELRGKVHGTLADGHEVELLESRTIRADDVTVVRRLRNVTLNSTVTARPPGKVVAFLVPQNIWTPIGGLGAAVFGYVTAGATKGDSNQSAEPTATPIPTRTATTTVSPEPVLPDNGNGFPVVEVIVAIVALLAAVQGFLHLGSHRLPRSRSGERAAPRKSSGVGRFALVVVAGVLVGVVLNLVLT